MCRPWPQRRSSDPTVRTSLARALLPAEALGLWRETASLDLSRPLPPLAGRSAAGGARHRQHPARHAGNPGGPRRAHHARSRPRGPRRVANSRRFGIIADDSAGEPLVETPVATFLRLIARAVADRLAPVPLLAMLKHPLAATGLAPVACRAAARALERDCLRGPRPAAGISGLRQGLDQARGGRRACLPSICSTGSKPRCCRCCGSPMATRLNHRPICSAP